MVINQFASSPSYNTGAGERHYYLASKLAGRGFDFTIISGGTNHLFTKSPVTKTLFNEEPITGGRFIWVKLKKYIPESIFGRVFSWFEFLVKLFLFPIKNYQRPDLVIVSSMSLWPVIYAAWIRKKLNVPFILEIRDIWPLTPIQIGGFSKHNPFIAVFRMLEKYAYSNADSIISVLSHFNDHLKGVTNNPKPVYWIPNAIENSGITEFQRISKENSHGRKFTIIYTGAVGTANAMEYLIKSADILREHKDIKFLIVGDGPSKESLIDLSKNNPQVLFMNKVPKEEVPRLLRDVDAGFISWKAIELYNYGVAANKYNDYMLAGLPIISASNIPDDPVTIAKCGLRVPAEDEKSIAEAILKLQSMHPDERNKLGENGYHFVVNHNTYNKIAEQYKSCIEETLTNFKTKI